MIKWTRQVSDVEGIPDAIGAQLKDGDVSRHSFAEFWEKFFRDVFSKEDPGAWNSVRCDLLDNSWRAQIYPWSTDDMEVCLEARLWLDLVDHQSALLTLFRDDDVYPKHENALMTVKAAMIDRIIRLLTDSFVDYASKSKFWNKKDYKNLTIQIYEHMEDLRVSITKDGIVSTNVY